MHKHFYKINKNSKEIWEYRLIANKFIKELNEQEVKQLLDQQKLDIFICRERDELELLSLEKIKGEWEMHYKNHFATEEKAQGKYFKDGYCYFAELWKGAFGKQIVVLYYSH